MKTTEKSTTIINGLRVTEQTVESTRSEDCLMLAKYYELLAKQYYELDMNGNVSIKPGIQDTQDHINTYTGYLNGYEGKDDVQ